MAKSSANTRFPLSEDQKTVLERFYQDGMQSKGKTCSSLHLQAQEATNLPLDVIQVLSCENSCSIGCMYVPIYTYMYIPLATWWTENCTCMSKFVSGVNQCQPLLLQNWISNHKREERKGAHRMDNSAVMKTDDPRPPKKGRLLSTPNAYNVHVAEYLKSEGSRNALSLNLEA